MKRLFKVISILLCACILSGCSIGKKGSPIGIATPTNSKLEIAGIWKVEGYIVKDSSISDVEQISNIENNLITIKSRSIEFGNKYYPGVKYKLKVVDDSYVISYEAKFKAAELDINDKDIKVYSILYQNNILGEVIKTSLGECYIYYEGVLYTISLEATINDDEQEVMKKSEESKSISYSHDINQGVYLGLKVGRDENSTQNSKEEYRTLWISTKENELQEVKERNEIIFPRVNGIWMLKQNAISDSEKNIYYEYFDATPIDVGISEKYSKSSAVKIDKGNLKEGTVLKRNLDFVGNNYIGTEVFVNKNHGLNPTFEILPIDNLYSGIPIVINDIYPEETSRVYKSAYENAYENLSDEEKSKLTKEISYSNFGLVRGNGKWILEGRISPIAGDEPYDFPLNILPNRKLINYDTLTIPWKILRGDVPFIVDAFISPNGKLALIILENELLIYNISNNSLDQYPLASIELKDNEQVIMAEWCEGDFIDKWSSVFKDSKVIE